MKQVTIGLFCVIFFFPVLLLQSQHYSKLLLEDRQWSVFWWYSECIFNPCNGWQFFVSGDTLMNGNQYKKVWSNGMYNATAPVFVPPFSLYPHPYLEGFMREDSLEKKVYSIWIEEPDREYLTYDFSLEIGDTLTIEYLGNWKILVDTITYVELNNGKLRKQFWFSSEEGLSMGNNMYIEGIGGSSTLMFPFDYSFEGGYDTGCLREKGKVLYGFLDEYYGCEPITSVLSPEEGDDLKIFPNPVYSELQVYNIPKGSFRMEILNLQGETVYSQYLLHSDQTIGIAGLPPGLYFLKIELSTQVLKYLKFIKL